MSLGCSGWRDRGETPIPHSQGSPAPGTRSLCTAEGTVLSPGHTQSFPAQSCCLQLPEAQGHQWLFINLCSGLAGPSTNEQGVGSPAGTQLYLHRAQDPNCCSQATFQPSPGACSCPLCWNELVLLLCVCSKGWCQGCAQHSLPLSPGSGEQPSFGPGAGVAPRRGLKGTAQPLLGLFQRPFLSHAGLLCLPCRPGNFWAGNSQGFVPSLHSHIHAGRQAGRAGMVVAAKRPVCS